ncbi:hypothetical protein SAMN06265360_13322 [Haloechinothrix alba]|uniref:Uncharacterized protein n=1 Tax=Haloechinothrix alba TaxID=664784 RepID=A0A239A8X0_9PSEU|nr:hypothetical protein [Haloechinothrix alba]SNR92096.1 hypothetical protein SAMN06265360_13322 [Haloechinothrix alba]
MTRSRSSRLSLRPGVRELDVTSLVPPKYAPQFADAEQVLEAIAGRGLRTRVLTPNPRGVQRAVELNDRLVLQSRLF